MAIASEKSEFIKDLIKVLGLDSSVLIGFTLKAHVNEPVKIETEDWASPLNDGTNILIKRWILTKEELTCTE